MIAFTVDRNWYHQYWFGEGVAASDVDHRVAVVRCIRVAAASAIRGVAFAFDAAFRAAARQRIGECR